MKNLKQFIIDNPEYILLLAVIFYWGSTAIVFNPVAIGLVVTLALQIILKNKITGLLIPSFIILACLYLFLALISEFNEFPTFSKEAKELLFVGLFLLSSTLIVSGLMLRKYLNLASNQG